MRKLIAMLSIALALTAGAQTNVTYVPAVTPAYVRGQLAAATNATAVRARADLSEHTNSSSHLTPAQAQRISAALTNETDAIALEALATNRVTRWYDATSDTFLETDGGTNLLRWARSLSDKTNVTFSADFADAENQTLFPLSLPFPISTNGFTINASDYGGTPIFAANSTRGGTWTSGDQSIPAELGWSGGGAHGSAYINIVPAGTIEIVARYQLFESLPLQSETWSYADMTNWMAEGGTGETWAKTLAGDIATSALNNHLGVADPHPGKYAPASITNAPEWIVYSNVVSSVVLTNHSERPVYLYATGNVAVSFSGLRAPAPIYFVARGPSSLTFPAGTHFVGGAYWQTNMSNHFIVWRYGTNLFCNPATTSED